MIYEYNFMIFSKLNLKLISKNNDSILAFFFKLFYIKLLIDLVYSNEFLILWKNNNERYN